MNSQAMGQPGRGISSAALLGVHLPMVEGHVRMLRLIQENAAGGSRDWNIVTAMLNRGNAMLDDVKNASRLMGHGAEGLDENEEPYLNGEEQKPSTAETNGEVAGRPKKVPKSRMKSVESTATSDQPYIKVEESSPPPGIQSPSIPTMKDSAPKESSSPAAAFIASGLNALRKRDLGERSSEGIEASPTKKVMNKKPTNDLAPAIEFEDITDEVDARLKAKEQLRAGAEAELQAQVQTLAQAQIKKEDIVENKRKRVYEEPEADVKPAQSAAATEDAKPRAKRTRKTVVKTENGSKESTADGEEQKGTNGKAQAAKKEIKPRGKKAAAKADSPKPKLRIRMPRAAASASTSYTESSVQSESPGASLAGKQQEKANPKGKGKAVNGGTAKGKKRKAADPPESASDDDGETITVRADPTTDDTADTSSTDKAPRGRRRTRGTAAATVDEGGQVGPKRRRKNTAAKA